MLTNNLEMSNMSIHMKMYKKPQIKNIEIMASLPPVAD